MTAAPVELDSARLLETARAVEACADGVTALLVGRAADAAGAAAPGSELSRAVDAVCEQLAGRAEGIEAALRDWAAAVRVGGEVFVATDRHLGAGVARAVTGRQVAR